MSDYKITKNKQGFSLERKDKKPIEIDLKPGESVKEALMRAIAAPDPRKVDVKVENHGSIMLFRPQTDDAKAWLEKSVQADAQWFGGALVVEPRYAADLAAGLEAEGFVL